MTIEHELAAPKLFLWDVKSGQLVISQPLAGCLWMPQATMYNHQLQALETRQVQSERAYHRPS